jgi:flagellar basal-body rod protein FlgG
MMQALRIAATGMHAQQLNVDVLSNNIANLNTTGFKQSKPAFQDLIYLNKMAPAAITDQTGTIAPTGLQIGLGVSTGSVYRIMEQGTLQPTGNSLDLAVSGRGFFRIQMPDGTIAYTRDGTFQQNQDGQIVTKEGYSLDPAITIPPDGTDLTITEGGVVTVKVNNVTTQLGTITLSMFTNEAGLESIGDNKYIETEASGTPTDTNPTENGSGSVKQAMLEQSNVDAITAITDLITAQRSYEMNSKIITTSDQMLQTLTQIQ